jgi:hypothetical protein
VLVGVLAWIDDLGVGVWCTLNSVSHWRSLDGHC